MKMEPDFKTDALARQVVGAALEVHRHLGPGFLESIYEEALCHELTLRNIPFERQVGFRILFKGHPVGRERLDLLIDERLIVELKAVDNPAPIHTAQVISYLKATGCRLALLINFNVPLLKMGIKNDSFITHGAHGVMAVHPLEPILC